MSMERDFNITIKLSNDLLERLELIVELEQLDRDELIIRALNRYIAERQDAFLREILQRGYQELADLNLCMASECFGIEEEADVVLVNIVNEV